MEPWQRDPGAPLSLLSFTGFLDAETFRPIEFSVLVTVNFTCQLSQATVPRYLVKYQSSSCWGGLFV